MYVEIYFRVFTSQERLAGSLSWLISKLAKFYDGQREFEGYSKIANMSNRMVDLTWICPLQASFLV